MTNFKVFEKTIKEMENDNISLDTLNTIYLGFIASSLAQIADILNEKWSKAQTPIDKKSKEWCALFKDQNGKLRSVEERALIRCLGEAGYSIDYIMHVLSAREAKKCESKK